jgi:hypothetical protein
VQLEAMQGRFDAARNLLAEAETKAKALAEELALRACSRRASRTRRATPNCLPAMLPLPSMRCVWGALTRFGVDRRDFDP